jgi:hypothetical protein
LTENIKTFIENVLPILLMLFIGVLASIILTRIIFKIILHFVYKKYQKLKQFRKSLKEKYQQKVTPENKEDTDLLRAKEELSAPKVPLPAVVQKMNNPELEEDNKSLAEVKIVDIVKPLGFWTSIVLGNKLTYLISSAKIMNKNSHKGFWVSMIEAQEKAQGREKGRSL